MERSHSVSAQASDRRGHGRPPAAPRPRSSARWVCPTMSSRAPRSARSDRLREARSREAPVRHDAEAAQPQQVGAPCASGSISSRNPRSAPRKQRAAQLRARGGHRRLPDRAQHRLGDALHQLQRDVPREAVGHDHVGHPSHHVAALDVADELERADARPRPLEQLRVGLHDQAVAALGLLAVREQPDARTLHPEHGPRQRRAHERELHEVLAPRLGVRAHVQQRHRPAGNRQRDRERRAVDAARALDVEQRPRPARRRCRRRTRAPAPCPRRPPWRPARSRPRASPGRLSRGRRSWRSTRARPRPRRPPAARRAPRRARTGSRARPAGRDRRAGRDLGRTEVGAVAVDRDHRRVRALGASGRGGAP